MRRALVQRRRELLATTMVTGVLLAGTLTGMVTTGVASAADAPTTVAPTTQVADTPTTEAANAAAQVDIDSTTTTTAEATTTTSAAPTTTTTTPQTEVEGSQEYPAACTNTATADTNTLTFNVTASALSPVITGADLTITNQHWTFSIPADLSDTLRSVFGSIPLATTVQVTVAGTNVQPDHITSGVIDSTIDLSGSGAATGTFDVPDMVFQPVNPGTAVFSMTTIVTNLPLGDAALVVTCLPDPAASFLSVDTYGAVIPTTTTTTIKKAGPAEPKSTTLPLTGPSNHTLWVEVLAGLLMVQLGLLFVVFSRRNRTTSTTSTT